MTHDPREALKTAIEHIEHMSAWIALRNSDQTALGTYSFESIGEDMPGMRQALSASAPKGETEPVAWRSRWKHEGHHEPGDWSYYNQKPPQDHKRYEVEPLYTSPPPAAGWNEALRELEVVAEKQKAYFNVKQNDFPGVENFTDGNGNLSLPDDMTPLLAQARANGRYSEADWWLSTIRALRREAPGSSGVAVAGYVPATGPIQSGDILRYEVDEETCVGKVTEHLRPDAGCDDNDGREECPKCGGDCSSANPPVFDCPMVGCNKDF